MTQRKVVAVNEKGAPIGEGHHRAKLTDQDIEWILELHHEHGLGYGTLAVKFEVSKSTVRDVIKGRIRAQIPAAYKTLR